MIFGKLISGHFDILMSHYSQLKKNRFFRAVQEWHNWLHSARTQRSDNSQTHLKTPGIHKYHSDTLRQPHRHPTDISIQHKTPADSNRHQQTATETNRRQQTPADTARCFLMSLAVSAGVCWCLLASVGVLCCLEMSGGVPLEVSEGI